MNVLQSNTKTGEAGDKKMKEKPFSLTSSNCKNPYINIKWQSSQLFGFVFLN